MNGWQVTHHAMSTVEVSSSQFFFLLFLEQMSIKRRKEVGGEPELTSWNGSTYRLKVPFYRCWSVTRVVLLLHTRWRLSDLPSSKFSVVLLLRTRERGSVGCISSWDMDLCRGSQKCHQQTSSIWKQHVIKSAPQECLGKLWFSKNKKELSYLMMWSKTFRDSNPEQKGLLTTQLLNTKISQYLAWFCS